MSLCSVPSESPVTLHHCFTHLPLLCYSFGTNWNVLKLPRCASLLKWLKAEKKHWKSTILRRRKYVGFVTARKSGTKLSPRIIYYLFLRAVFKKPSWFSYGNKIVCPSGTTDRAKISYPRTCRPLANSSWSSSLDSGLVCCVSGSVWSPQFL